MDKKIVAAVLKAQEEADTTAAATTTAVTTTDQAANTASTLSNVCVSPVPHFVVHLPCGPSPLFGTAASFESSTIGPPGMQHYGPPQAYNHERYSPHPSGYAVLVKQEHYHPDANGRGCSCPHNLGFLVMILLHDIMGHNKPMLPAEI